MAESASRTPSFSHKSSMALSPHTPPPTLDRSALSSTPTPLRRQGPESAFCSIPRCVFYALREDEDCQHGLIALSPEKVVEPSTPLSAEFAGESQFLFATSSPEAAFFFAERGCGPGFVGANGRRRPASKRVVAKIDLNQFEGEVLDVSTVEGCDQHGLKKHSKAWEFALDHHMVLLVGYIQPDLVVNVFDLEKCKSQLQTVRSPCGRTQQYFDDFAAALPSQTKDFLAQEWAGEIECLHRAIGRKARDPKGLAADSVSYAAVCWKAKKSLDEELRELELRRRQLQPHLEMVKDNELRSVERALKESLQRGRIGPIEHFQIIQMQDWSCTEEFPYWATTACHDRSSIWLRGLQYETRLALNGPAAIENVREFARDYPTWDDEKKIYIPCRHCMGTKAAEFHLLRNVRKSVVWPPHFRLFSFDSATQELDEILNTLGGTCARDSEHPHVFAKDDVGFSFELKRIPMALAGLEATLPRTNVEDLCEVERVLPQRPLYLLLVVPEGASAMVAENDDEDGLRVFPCVPCRGCR